MQSTDSIALDHLSEYVPPELQNLNDLDTAIPELAKNARMITAIETSIRNIPTMHQLFLTDAKLPPDIPDESIHLVLTSPPYWTLKRYRETEGHLGHVEDYEKFLDSLDTVWRWIFKTLTPGGRLICVVGDVCLSRRKNNGEHTCVPLH